MLINPMTMLLLILSLALGTLITLSSFHWLLAWAGLEISTLAIIPLISKQHHPRATEAATKYFLIQAAASALVIFSASINSWKAGQWDISQFSTPEATITLTLALAMKLALAPFHFWLPEVLQGSTLYVAMTISTWQKLAPTMLLYMNINNLNKPALIAIGLLSSLLGGWLGLNQTQTRKIMAYSSVAHMGWMFTALALNPNLAMTTLLIYLTLTLAMFTTITMTSSKTLLDLGTTWPQSPLLLSTTMLTLMSLGGLPPLTGFIPKWLILKELSSNNFFMISTMMALSALPSLYFYLRMSHMTTLTLPPNTTNSKHQWRLTLHTPSALPTVILANLLLPITPLILTVC